MRNPLIGILPAPLNGGSTSHWHNMKNINRSLCVLLAFTFSACTAQDGLIFSGDFKEAHQNASNIAGYEVPLAGYLFVPGYEGTNNLESDHPVLFETREQYLSQDIGHAFYVDVKPESVSSCAGKFVNVVANLEVKKDKMVWLINPSLVDQGHVPAIREALRDDALVEDNAWMPCGPKVQ